MATSGSTNYAATRDDIITEALEIAGVLGEGQSPNADQLTSCSRTLNYMVKAWQARGTNMFAITEQTVALDTVSNSYSLSVAGGTRFRRIMNVVVRDSSGNDTPVEEITREEYSMLTPKSTTGRVTQVYYDRNYPVGTLKIWPVNSNTGDSLVLWVERPLDDLDAATDEVDYPQEWFLALAYNLALFVAPKYGVSDQQANLIQTLAQASLLDAEEGDRELNLKFQPENRW